MTHDQRTWRIELLFWTAVVCALLAWAVGEARAQTDEEWATVKCSVGNFHATGVIVATNGSESIVVTVSHLFDSPTSTAYVHPIYAQRPYRAEVLLVHNKQTMDVSFLAFAHPGKTYRAVPLSETPLRAGADVRMIGYPLATMRQKIRQGRILSVGDWRMTKNGVPIAICSFPAIRGDSGAPIFAGSSVVGIVWGSDEYGRAHVTPSSYVLRVLETQCARGRYGWICRPPSGSQIVQMPRQQPPELSPSLEPGGREPPGSGLEKIDYDKLAAKVLERMKADADSFRGPAGPAGLNGKDGSDGASASDGLTHEHVQAMIVAATAELKPIRFVFPSGEHRDVRLGQQLPLNLSGEIVGKK